MIEAGLEFNGPVDPVLAAFADLPNPVRPVFFSHEEQPNSDADRVDNPKRLAAFVARSMSGFFLLGPRVTYSIRIAAGTSLVCDCFIGEDAGHVTRFLEHMAQAKPLFGFACAPEERERRNRVIFKQGANKIESWVGRDVQKYVPGFYWLTLLSDALAQQHNIDLSAVELVAQDHMELDGGNHLFRFYDRPEDWQTTSEVTDLCASLPGVFDVERVRSQMATVRTFLGLNSMLMEWK